MISFKAVAHRPHKKLASTSSLSVSMATPLTHVASLVLTAVLASTEANSSHMSAVTQPFTMSMAMSK